jgi:peptide/nickel transport system permease protein
VAPVTPAVTAAQTEPLPPGVLLSVRELCVDYATERGRSRVVDCVSFDIAPGEVFGLAGESGSGKSTIGYGLLRLLPPAASISQGRILLGDTDVTALGADALRAFRWAQVSMVFQSAMSALNPVLTLGEQFHDTLVAHGPSSRASSYARARELLAMVGLEPKLVHAWPHQLSGGMRQRVGIALALALQPKLVVMDEPTTALDVVVQKELLQRVLELKSRLGFAVLFITHDLALLLELATRIAVLYAGRLVEAAPAAELLARPRHPYTEGLLRSFPSLQAAGTLAGGIAGAPPDMRHPPDGCRFHPRCEQAALRCEREVPALRVLPEGRLCACHFA